MTILIILAIFTALLLWYALAGRDWLKRQPFGQTFFELVEPVELLLFKKSETILFARTLSGLGAALTMLQQVDGINLAPILPLVPEAWQGVVSFAVGCLPLLISLLGMIVEWLRNRTTKPVALVAVAEADITPEVARVIASADAVKEKAVEVVTQAKAA
jgi:hypothetical protein